MAPTDPLYERDPEAWQAHLAEGNAMQPRKRVVADVLIRDEQDRILLVDPNYKPDWDLPGGMVEANEPPHLAAQREIEEELGLEIEISVVLCVDWVSPHEAWDDSLAFVFDGGRLTPTQSEKITLGKELDSFRFCPSREAAESLRPYVWRRAQAALRTLEAGPVYLVDGTSL